MIEVNPRVKDALRSGAYRKNYRINVLNDDGTTDFTLNNTELVSESVKIDERMCSGDILKFGLCEGSSIEFQYFNHDNINHPNIRGRRIQVFVDVQYKDSDGEIAWEPIPLGYFDIQECSTQFSTGIMKVVGYNKLRSDYLDQNANMEIEEAFSGINSATVMDILDFMLNGYAIDAKDHTFIDASDWDFQTGGESVTIRYNNVRTDFGNPLTPDGIWVDSTSQNVYPVIDCYSMYWDVPNGDYVQVRSSMDLDEISATIRDKLADAIDALNINQSTQSVINDTFYNVREYSLIRNSKYACAFVIEYTDNTKEYYGLTNGGHTFKELFRKTLEGVAYISFFFVRRYYMSTTKYVGSSPPTYALIKEEMLPDGTTEYSWEDSNGVLHTEAYTYPEELWNISYADIKDSITVAEIDGVTGMDTVQIDPTTIPDVTLRELQSAVYETQAEFGQLSRITDLFDGVTLSRERLFPADDLYPSDTLYPQGTSESTFKSMYEKLWTDSVGEQTFRKLYITYKGLDDQQREKEFVLERTVNADGTTDYYCDDNWLFKNLVWTAEQVGAYADAMVLKMRGIKWFPFEMWSAGLPYIEVGDELEIISKDGTYTSYVLQRSLNGIQNLKDTYINGSLDIF